jgi:hypothetical protein
MLLEWNRNTKGVHCQKGSLTKGFSQVWINSERGDSKLRCTDSSDNLSSSFHSENANSNKSLLELSHNVTGSGDTGMDKSGFSKSKTLPALPEPMVTPMGGAETHLAVMSGWWLCKPYNPNAIGTQTKGDTHPLFPNIR